ncbi:MAG: hypothetical protein WB819_00485 [Terriglobia bacterium]
MAPGRRFSEFATHPQPSQSIRFPSWYLSMIGIHLFAKGQSVRQVGSIRTTEYAGRARAESRSLLIDMCRGPFPPARLAISAVLARPLTVEFSGIYPAKNPAPQRLGGQATRRAGAKGIDTF